jgi:hypothetical protein
LFKEKIKEVIVYLPEKGDNCFMEFFSGVIILGVSPGLEKKSEICSK